MISIREAREIAELTQAEASEALAIPLRFIEDWEAGRRPCVDWVEKLLVSELLHIARTRNL